MAFVHADFAKRLKMAMDYHELNQESLAQKMADVRFMRNRSKSHAKGLPDLRERRPSRGCISSWLRGRSKPNGSNVQLLCSQHVLDVNRLWLMEGDGSLAPAWALGVTLDRLGELMSTKVEEMALEPIARKVETDRQEALRGLVTDPFIQAVIADDQEELKRIQEERKSEDDDLLKISDLQSLFGWTPVYAPKVRVQMSFGIAILVLDLLENLERKMYDKAKGRAPGFGVKDQVVAMKDAIHRSDIMAVLVTAVAGESLPVDSIVAEQALEDVRNTILPQIRRLFPGQNPLSDDLD